MMTNLKKLRVIWCILAASLALASPAAAATIVNGSFEDPVSPPGSAPQFVTGQNLGGWEVLGDEIAILVEPYAFGGYDYNSQDGSQHLDMQGYNNNGTAKGVRQTVATLAGMSYSLAFWVGNTGGILSPDPSVIHLYIDGNLHGTAMNNLTNPDTVNWQQYAYTFTATGASTVISLVNGTTAGDLYAGLDNVTITDVSAVPEPSTGLLALLAAPVLALARRRYFRTKA